jgi:acid phosphatase (class A)
MNLKSYLRPQTLGGQRLRSFTGRFGFQALMLCVLLRISMPLLDAAPYLAAGRPDGIALLAPPPSPGSAEEAADLACTRSVFQGRTPAEEALALKDSSLSFAIFGAAIGPCFDLKKLPRTEALMLKIKKEIGPAIDSSKDHWKRKRPYQLDEELSLGSPEPSFGYPSGHSTRGTVYSLVLADLFPEQRLAILAQGREIGWDRVVIGKHFPTDIYAGRVLGQAIVRELMESPEFQHDLAEARAEVKSVCGGTAANR